MKGSLEGKRFGNYIAFEVIGRGGMGTVYLAEHPQIKRQVAIKVLNRNHSQEIVDRFLAEATAVNRIGNPHIIDIYDFGRTESGRVYYVMEALKGKELSAVMTEHQRMPPVDVVPYVEQICAALQAAHDHDVVHRDLKPENIFVIDGTPMQLKVLDFGIAKLLDSAGGNSRTSPGTVLGTPMFTSPEQARGDLSKIGPASDLYSLGVIVYWMLTGRPPFMASSMALLLAMHLSDAPKPIRELMPAVGPRIAKCVEQCLAKTSEDRPASARAFAAEFAAAVKLEESIKLSQDEAFAPEASGVMVFVPDGPVVEGRREFAAKSPEPVERFRTDESGDRAIHTAETADAPAAIEETSTQVETVNAKLHPSTKPAQQTQTGPMPAVETTSIPAQTGPMPAAQATATLTQTGPMPAAQATATLTQTGPMPAAQTTATPTQTGPMPAARTTATPTQTGPMPATEREPETKEAAAIAAVQTAPMPRPAGDPPTPRECEDSGGKAAAASRDPTMRDHEGERNGEARAETSSEKTETPSATSARPVEREAQTSPTRSTSSENVKLVIALLAGAAIAALIFLLLR